MSDAVDLNPQPRSSGKKSPDAFRTISEVADTLNVPQHVLRFWENKFTQVKPLKRGGGRRYYRPEDVHLLRGIRNLLYHEGYTIRGVQKVLRDAGTKMVVEAGRQDGGGAVPQNRNEGPPAHQVLGDRATGAGTVSEALVAGLPTTGLDQDQRAKLEAILARLKGLTTLLKEAD